MAFAKNNIRTQVIYPAVKHNWKPDSSNFQLFFSDAP